MQFTITLIPQDYIDARRLALRPRKGMRILLYALLILMALAFADDIRRSLLSHRWTSAMGWPVFAIVYLPLWYFVLIPMGTRKIFRQQKNLHDPMTFSFTDQGMRADSVRGHVELPWSDFPKWKANDKVLILYQSNAIFNMIPRRVFENEADFTGFRELVERHLGKQKP